MTSLRSPGEPSASGSISARRTAKFRLCPGQMRPSSPGTLARTRWTMFVDDVVVAARDPHLVAEQPIARPEYSVAPSRTARVVISASEEPACGSDRHMVPNQRPSICGRRKHFDLGLRTEGRQQSRIGDRQHRIGRGRNVGSHGHGGRCGVDQARNLRAAETFVERRGKQSGFGVSLQSGIYLRQNADCLIIENRLVMIGLFVMGSKMARPRGGSSGRGSRRMFRDYGCETWKPGRVRPHRANRREENQGSRG